MFTYIITIKNMSNIVFYSYIKCNISMSYEPTYNIFKKEMKECNVVQQHSQILLSTTGCE